MEGTGKIDPTKLPEARVAGTDVTPSKPAAPSAPAAKVKAEVADNTKSSPAVPKRAQKPAANGNALIQLGAYGSKAVAEQAWTESWRTEGRRGRKEGGSTGTTRW